MIKIKGLDFPKDISLFFTTPLVVFKWRKKVKKTGFNKLLHSLNSLETCQEPNGRQLAKLEKQHKVMNAYLKKIIKHPNPCIITSLALFDECKKQKINAKLVVGADKDKDVVTGHSWVEVRGTALNECNERLKKYTRMTEI